jgi:hypothetical protein
MIILSQKFVHEDQDFEISVKYDKVLKKVLEVKNIVIHTHGNWYPVGNIMTKFFKEAVQKLIDQTDWEAICKEYSEPAPRKIHPICEQALRPFKIFT